MRVEKRCAKKGDKTRGKEMSEKRETERFFLSFPTLGWPQERVEIDRFIWIGKVDLSPQKTCFLPNQMTNEPIDLLFTIQGAQCPLSAHDGPHNGQVSEVYHRRSPLTDSSPGRRTPTTVLYVQPCCYVKHSDALPCFTQNDKQSRF